MRPDHVVVTGDHTHDELPETYAPCGRSSSPWLDRLWPLPGNHDDRAALRSAFADRIGGDGRRAGSSSPSRRAGGSASASTRRSPARWAGGSAPTRSSGSAEQLDEPRPRAAVLFMHHPPVELGLRVARPDRARGRGAAAGAARRGRAHPARLLRPRPSRVVASGRCGAEVVTMPSTGLQFSPVSDVGAVRRPLPRATASIELDGDGYTTSVVRLPEARYSPTVQPMTRARDTACRPRDRGPGEGSDARRRSRSRRRACPSSSRARSVDELDAVVAEIAAAGGEAAALACDLTDRAAVDDARRAGRRGASGRSTSSSTTRASAAAPIRGRSPSSGTRSGTRRSS